METELELGQYKNFAPTCFDHEGAFLSERQKWCVAPVGRTRDSGPLANSNFETLENDLDKLDPDYIDHESYSFNHWGPGWFEIILVRPETPCYYIAVEACKALEDYPVLDDEDHSRREYKEVCEAWKYTSIADRVDICIRHKLSCLVARHDSIPQGLPYYDDFYRPGN